jgi:hypothetical protein
MSQEFLGERSRSRLRGAAADRAEDSRQRLDQVRVEGNLPVLGPGVNQAELGESGVFRDLFEEILYDR